MELPPAGPSEAEVAGIIDRISALEQCVVSIDGRVVHNTVFVEAERAAESVLAGYDVADLDKAHAEIGGLNGEFDPHEHGASNALMQNMLEQGHELIRNNPTGVTSILTVTQAVKGLGVPHGNTSLYAATTTTTRVPAGVSPLAPTATVLPASLQPLSEAHSNVAVEPAVPEFTLAEGGSGAGAGADAGAGAGAGAGKAGAAGSLVPALKTVQTAAVPVAAPGGASMASTTPSAAVQLIPAGVTSREQSQAHPDPARAQLCMALNKRVERELNIHRLEEKVCELQKALASMGDGLRAAQAAVAGRDSEDAERAAALLQRLAEMEAGVEAAAKLAHAATALANTAITGVSAVPAPTDYTAEFYKLAAADAALRQEIAPLPGLAEELRVLRDEALPTKADQTAVEARFLPPPHRHTPHARSRRPCSNAWA